MRAALEISYFCREKPFNFNALQCQLCQAGMALLRPLQGGACNSYRFRQFPCCQKPTGGFLSCVFPFSPRRLPPPLPFLAAPTAALAAAMAAGKTTAAMCFATMTQTNAQAQTRGVLGKSG